MGWGLAFLACGVQRPPYCANALYTAAALAHWGSGTTLSAYYGARVSDVDIGRSRMYGDLVGAVTDGKRASRHLAQLAGARVHAKNRNVIGARVRRKHKAGIATGGEGDFPGITLGVGDFNDDRTGRSASGKDPGPGIYGARAIRDLVLERWDTVRGTQGNALVDE